MTAQQLNLDNIANNLANSTPSFLIISKQDMGFFHLRMLKENDCWTENNFKFTIIRTREQSSGVLR